MSKNVERYESLLDLTGQESGLVLYGINSLGMDEDGVELMICNWSSIKGMPRVDPMGFGLVGTGEILTIDEIQDVNDIGVYLGAIEVELNLFSLPPKFELVWDRNNDLEDLMGTAGMLCYVRPHYDIGEDDEHDGDVFTVIAPYGWA